MSQAAAAYQPGVCNINREEIANRRKIGHIGLTIFMVLLIILVCIDISRLYRVILFLPAVIGASGYLQARNHFCVGYAGAGMQNAEEGSGEASKIADEAARALDKRRARTMNLQSVGIGLIATAVAIAIPHL